LGGSSRRRAGCCARALRAAAPRRCTPSRRARAPR
jgi:hypothetical protein